MKRRIFVSSVEKELKDERLTVRDVVNTTPSLSAHFEPLLYELMPTATHGGLSGALKALDTCQVYLLIVGAEYGTVVADGLSITHHEYRHARENTAMPKLVFVLGDNNMNREPGTKVLLDEIKNDDVKYKRFHNVVELRNEVQAALKNLLEDGCVTFSRRSLKGVFMACLVVLLLGIFALNAVSRWLRGRRFEELQVTQKQCQAIEEKLRNRYPQIEPKDEGNQIYVDDSNSVLAQDVWRNGRLDQRTLFLEGRPRARDQFIYDGDKLTGKKRYYLDDSHRIFLVDDFASDGLLTRKLDCPDGLQKPCNDYFDLMRSPLPPVEQVFSYR